MGDAPVAWQAHIGGFLVGLFAFSLFDPPRDVASVDISASEAQPDIEDTAVLPHDPETRPQLIQPPFET